MVGEKAGKLKIKRLVRYKCSNVNKTGSNETEKKTVVQLGGMHVDKIVRKILHNGLDLNYEEKVIRVLKGRPL